MFEVKYFISLYIICCEFIPHLQYYKGQMSDTPSRKVLCLFLAHKHVKQYYYRVSEAYLEHSRASKIEIFHEIS